MVRRGLYESGWDQPKCVESPRVKYECLLGKIIDRLICCKILLFCGSLGVNKKS